MPGPCVLSYDARMVSDGLPTPPVQRADVGRRPFTLSPFRGLRFAADTVGDLGNVISDEY